MSSTTAGAGLPGQGSYGLERAMDNEITGSLMPHVEFLRRSQLRLQSAEQRIMLLEGLIKTILSLEKKLTSRGDVG